MDYYQIGQRVRKYRKAQGLSQEELAARVGISVTHMSHIETGNTKLSLPVLVELACALGVQSDDLLFDRGSERSRVLAELSDTLDRCYLPAAAHPDRQSSRPPRYRWTSTSSPERRQRLCSTYDLSRPARHAKSKTPKAYASGVSVLREAGIYLFSQAVSSQLSSGTSELNFCVRNGNRWDLTVIDTGCPESIFRTILSILF